MIRKPGAANNLPNFGLGDPLPTVRIGDLLVARKACPRKGRL